MKHLQCPLEKMEVIRPRLIGHGTMAGGVATGGRLGLKGKRKSKVLRPSSVLDSIRYCTSIPSSTKLDKWVGLEIKNLPTRFCGLAAFHTYRSFVRFPTSSLDVFSLQKVATNEEFAGADG